MNKVLVNVYVPILNKSYDIFIPLQSQIFEIVELINNSICYLKELELKEINKPLITYTGIRYDGKELKEPYNCHPSSQTFEDYETSSRISPFALMTKIRNHLP